MHTITIKTAEIAVGGLSKTSKMPTMSISLPATLCKTGSKLRKVKGSVCSKCYACKGAYVWASTEKALKRRYDALGGPYWIESMVFLMNNKKRIKDSGLFRWHDSGDLQSIDHLKAIVEVAKLTPHIKHWLPTKEKGIISRFLSENAVPDNLIIRLSGAMIDGPKPKTLGKLSTINSSTVTTDKAAATCRAFENEGQCGDCRQCWDKSIQNIVYLAH
jgi:hypothetical protein